MRAGLVELDRLSGTLHGYCKCIELGTVVCHCIEGTKPMMLLEKRGGAPCLVVLPLYLRARGGRERSRRNFCSRRLASSL